MELRASSRKISDENVTLGKVFNGMNAASGKRVARKASIQETIHLASRHEVISGTEHKPPDVLLLEIKSMRKSLRAELKNKTVKKKVARSSSRLSVGDSRSISVSGTSLYAGTSATPSRVSSAFSRDFTEIFVNGNAPVEKKSEVFSKEASKKKSEYAPSVYSRHMRSSSPLLVSGIVDNPDNKGHAKKELHSSAATSGLKARKKSQQTEKNANSQFSKEIISDCSAEVAESAPSDISSTNIEDSGEDYSPKEKEFLVRMKDPQLKESLQNIIRRRRNSVRFVPSRTDYCRASENEDEVGKNQALAPFDEDQPNFDTDSVFEGTDIESQRPTSALSTARSTSLSHTHEVLSNADTVASESFRAEDEASVRRASTARQLKRRSDSLSCISGGTRQLSSARSSSSILSRGVSSQGLRVKRKTDVLIEETRIIRPGTAKGSASHVLRQRHKRQGTVPSFVLTTPELSPLTLEERATIRETQMFREFLLMYAKVKINPKRYEEAERVRMMSETPEFVIKSAIGQFLTRAFPSAGPTFLNASGRSKEDRKEDLQRMRLLRIKTCMEHLAAVA